MRIEKMSWENSDKFQTKQNKERKKTKRKERKEVPIETNLWHNCAFIIFSSNDASLQVTKYSCTFIIIFFILF